MRIGRIKLAIKALFNPSELWKNSFYFPEIYILNSYGHTLSRKNHKSIDYLGKPIPWFTYPSIEYIKQFNLRNYDVLEWGTGNSTLFFANSCKSVTAIEHDKCCYKQIKGKLPENVNYHLVTEKEYTHYPLQFKKKYDLIIINGIKRQECIEIALRILNETGFIIYNNADKYPAHCLFLRENNFIEVDFHGFGPINSYTWTTSIFFNRKFNPVPLTHQPRIPVGGGY